MGRPQAGLKPRVAPLLLRALPLADVSAAALRHYQALLDDGERTRAARFRSAGDARAYVCAHGLLRLTLSEFCPALAPADWRFVVDPRGKPHIAPLPAGGRGWGGGGGAPPGFSLTHSRGLAACAVGAGHDIGVDAESLDRKLAPLPLARRFFTAAEAQALEALPDDDARRRGFIRLWTLKEAVVKATGSGLAQSLQGFSFSPTDPPALRIHDPGLGAAADWRLQTWEVGGCALALALRGALAHEVYPDFQLVEPLS